MKHVQNGRQEGLHNKTDIEVYKQSRILENKTCENILLMETIIINVDEQM